jgi:RHS repeat-associated protein
MTDAAGELLSNTLYYPFGFHRHEHNAAQSDLGYRFSGKERDEESGLHYFETRFYGGDVAHFLSVDPAATQTSEGELDPQRLNPYAYSLNRPLVYVDPTGNQSDVDVETVEVLAAMADQVTTAVAEAADALTFGLSSYLVGEPEKLETAMGGPGGAIPVPVDTPENNDRLLRNTGRAYGGALTFGAVEAAVGTVMGRLAARIKAGAEVANVASRSSAKVATGGAGQIRSTFKTPQGVTVNIRDAPVRSTFKTQQGITVIVRDAPAAQAARGGQTAFYTEPRLQRIAAEMLGLQAGGSTFPAQVMLEMAQQGERAAVGRLHPYFLRGHAGAAKAGDIGLAQSAQTLSDISYTLGTP